uniref:Uncharacterized protein n=1 Tax=Panagrolaimus sp. ES5 TaxID=591445 RepID=A0AC34FFQ2_9BILA
MYSIIDEKAAITLVSRYNISENAPIFFAEKLEELTGTYDELTRKLDEQKTIRKDCYKKNLEKKCEESNVSNLYKISSNVFAYFCASVTFFGLICCIFISKARKLGLSPEQEMACKYELTSTNCIIILTTVCGAIVPFVGSLNPCYLEDAYKMFDM